MEHKLDTALTRYFSRLSKVGYIPYDEVSSILMLEYIIELKKFPLTQAEEITVDKAMSCLQGSCLIPYESCKGYCI